LSGTACRRRAQQHPALHACMHACMHGMACAAAAPHAATLPAQRSTAPLPALRVMPSAPCAPASRRHAARHQRVGARGRHAGWELCRGERGGRRGAAILRPLVSLQRRQKPLEERPVQRVQVCGPAQAVGARSSMCLSVHCHDGHPAALDTPHAHTHPTRIHTRTHRAAPPGATCTT
jgi:hypothetical protein